MPHTPGPLPRIYYEVNKTPGDEPLVLLEGMGAQMVGWRQGFLDLLEAQGLSVIRMDNRDVGLSEKLGKWHQHDARYTVLDMADDVCRVLDALGLESAHIVGQSMGGIIAQAMAIHRPDRVRSLNLIYTAPAFDAALVQPDFLKELNKGMLKLPFQLPRWLLLRMFMANLERCDSKVYPTDRAWLRELIALSHQRGFRLDGIARQRAAVQTSFDHRPHLAGITAPTTIIHGHADHLIRVEAAFQLAAAIPDSGLHVFPGMGHVVAEQLWGDIVAIIAGNARRAFNQTTSRKAVA